MEQSSIKILKDGKELLSFANINWLETGDKAMFSKRDQVYAAIAQGGGAAINTLAFVVNHLRHLHDLSPL